MRVHYFFKISPAIIRVSSGLSLILASNFQINETKASILWTMSISLGISGFLYGTLGEHLARKYMNLILSPKLFMFSILLSVSAMYIEPSQIVSQSILLSILALLYQISRIRNNFLILLVIYFSSIVRVALPLITEENFLFLLSSIYVLSLLTYSIVTLQGHKYWLATQNQLKSSIFGATLLSFNWFLIQQSFTFFVLHKTQLGISTAANLIILTRIFEMSTFPAAYQAFNAPNYIDDIKLSALKSKILKSEVLQVVTSFTVFTIFVFVSNNAMFEKYQLPLAWIFIVGSCYIMAPDAMHCTPSLLRLSPPTSMYVRLILVSIFLQIIVGYFLISGQISIALMLLSLNYSYAYVRIKKATFEVFPNG